MRRRGCAATSTPRVSCVNGSEFFGFSTHLKWVEDTRSWRLFFVTISVYEFSLSSYGGDSLGGRFTVGGDFNFRELQYFLNFSRIIILLCVSVAACDILIFVFTSNSA